MTDLTSLPKEELIKMLENQTPVESKNCIYKPIRGSQKECTSKAVTLHGFCKKHSRTVQARKLQKYVEERSEADVRPSESSVKEVKDVESNPGPEPEESIDDTIHKIQPQKIRKKRITANMWGRFEDPDTHICFDSKTHQAYGVQAKDGSVRALSEHHIAICEKNGWNYLSPYLDTDDSDSDFSHEEISSDEGSEEFETDDEVSDSDGDDVGSFDDSEEEVESEEDNDDSESSNSGDEYYY